MIRVCRFGVAWVGAKVFERGKSWDPCIGLPATFIASGDRSAAAFGACRASGRGASFGRAWCRGRQVRRTLYVQGDYTLGVSPLAETIAACLAERPEVLDVYLFGSQARGNARPNSDVDVAIFVDPRVPQPVPWGHAAELTTCLIRALGRNDVDVAILNRATPLLYHLVLRDGIRIVSRELCATTERELVARSRWLDWQVHQRKVA